MYEVKKKKKGTCDLLRIYGVVEFVGINTGIPSAPTIMISTFGAIFCKA